MAEIKAWKQASTVDCALDAWDFAPGVLLAASHASFVNSPSTPQVQLIEVVNFHQHVNQSHFSINCKSITTASYCKTSVHVHRWSDQPGAPVLYKSEHIKEFPSIYRAGGIFMDSPAYGFLSLIFHSWLH